MASHRTSTTPQALIRSFAEPIGKVYLLYGDPLIFRLSLLMAAQAVRRGMPLAIVDGCNRFDLHAITRFAREHSLDPQKLLEKIFVSRGFTCYQMEAAISRKLPAFLECIGSNIALIFGLLDTFYDEQAPLREVQQMVSRLLDTFQAMKADNISILLACTEWNVHPPDRNRLFTTLKSGMDRIYRLTAAQDNRPQLTFEHVAKKGGMNNGKNRPHLHEYHR